MEEEKKRRRRGRGEGTIYKRKDGRWAADITVGYENGKRLRRTFYGKTRQAVSDQLKEAQGKQVRGEVIPTGKQTVGDFLDHWLEHSIKPYRSPRTVLSYESQIKTHIKTALGHRLLRKLRGEHVQGFVSGLLKKGLSPRSVSYARAVLRMALQTACERKLLPFNPAADGVAVPSVRRRVVEAITIERTRAILEAIEGHRLAALFTLMLYSGLRRGEALGLRWSDVDLERRTLVVAQTLQRLNGELVFGDTKTEQSRRVIILASGAVSSLREYRLRQNSERIGLGPDWTETGLVFTTECGMPVDPRNVKRVFDRLLKDAKLPHMRLHDLRHGCATWLLAEGVDLKTISTILGHSSIRVTADVYAHVSQQQIGAAMDRLDQSMAK